MNAIARKLLYIHLISFMDINRRGVNSLKSALKYLVFVHRKSEGVNKLNGLSSLFDGLGPETFGIASPSLSF